MANIWNALSDRTRREILTMLRDRDLTAGEIADGFALSKATVSHHLSILKDAGLIEGRKQAQTITYHLNAGQCWDFWRGLTDWIVRGGSNEDAKIHGDSDRRGAGQFDCNGGTGGAAAAGDSGALQRPV